MIPEEIESPPTGRPYIVEASCAMVYYAAERTLMTVLFFALGLMGLGFVIDRYGVALHLAPHAALQPHSTYSLWTGSVLVLAGSLTAIVAAFRYIGLERRFQRECRGIIGHGLTLGVVFSLFVALTGVAISLLLTGVRY